MIAQDYTRTFYYERAKLGGWRIIERGPDVFQVAEVVSRESVAAYDVAGLNSGSLRIDRHALIGCKVVPV